MMHRHSKLSFFSTKKKPVPMGKDEGHMMPAARQTLMYTSWLLSLDRRNHQLVGNEAPGKRSIVVMAVWRQRKDILLMEHFSQIMIFCGNSGQVRGFRDGQGCSDLHWRKG